MKLSDYAVTAILEELESRTKEAKEEASQDRSDNYKQGYYEAYFEVLEIIENRKDW